MQLDKETESNLLLPPGGTPKLQRTIQAQSKGLKNDFTSKWDSKVRQPYLYKTNIFPVEKGNKRQGGTLQND